jgi:hypothetical protein
VPELVLVTAGTCSCTVGGTALSGGPGTLWLMPADVPQYQHNPGPVRTTASGSSLCGLASDGAAA